MSKKDSNLRTRKTHIDFNFENPEILVDGIPSGNHQTNAVNLLPNGTLVWHSGSTCNLCMKMMIGMQHTMGQFDNKGTGILATGVRNSFDGVWVDDILFSDNGQDTMGEDFPDEEVNLLGRS